METLLEQLAPRRDDGQPPALQLYRALQAAIRAGRFPAGQRLPSERSLCEAIGVARGTLRHALNALEQEGLLTASDRSGWYVPEGVLEEPSNTLLSFTEMARARGLEATATVLVQQLRDAQLDEAERLRVAPGAPVLELERLRLLDGVAVAVTRNLLRQSLAPELREQDFTRASLFEVLETKHGVHPVRTEYTVQAAGADERHAELLGLQPGAPVLVGSWLTFDQQQRPVEMGAVTYRGDRYRFTATLHRPAASPSSPADS